MKVMWAMEFFFLEQDIFVGHCSGHNLKISSPWFLRIGIVVESAAGFAAIPSGKNHALEQRRRSKAAAREIRRT